MRQVAWSKPQPEPSPLFQACCYDKGLQVRYLILLPQVTLITNAPRLSGRYSDLFFSGRDSRPSDSSALSRAPVIKASYRDRPSTHTCPTLRFPRYSKACRSPSRDNHATERWGYAPVRRGSRALRRWRRSCLPTLL